MITPSCAPLPPLPPIDPARGKRYIVLASGLNIGGDANTGVSLL